MFKRGKISLNLAKKAIEYYKMIPLRLVDIEIYKAVEVSHKYNTYAYDAYFLECAKNYNYPLLTLDNGLLESARKMNINAIEV